MAGQNAADLRIYAVPAKGPALDLEAVAILRQHQGLPPHQRELLANLAVFLAQVEGSASVTAAHVAAAADIAKGTALGDAAGPLQAESAAPQKSVSIATARHGAVRWTMAAGAAACAVAAGVAIALLPRPFGRTATSPGQEAGAPAPAEAPPEVGLADAALKPAPVPSRPAWPPLPAAVPAHVTVTYKHGSASAEARAAQLVQALRAQGYDAASPEQAASAQRQFRIGYFFAEDEGVASAVARTVAGIDPAWADAAPAQLAAPSALLPRPGSVVMMLPSTPGRHE